MSLRGWTLTSLGFALAGSVSGQVPDVRFRLDLLGNLTSLRNGPLTLRLYDPLGRTSTMALTSLFDNGFRAFVSERVQGIQRDPSADPFEEYYLEDPHIWRVGKQFLPFGAGAFFRENVAAARIESNLVFERLLLTAAAFDGGSGAQRGISVRLGNTIGISGAFGEHFGIAPTSLDLIRRPEDTPGRGHGWAQAFDLDVSRRKGPFTFQGEAAWLSKGATRADPNLGVVDLSAVYQIDRRHSATLGWTKDASNGDSFYRLLGSARIGQNAFLEPMARMKNDGLYDLSISLRIRI